MLTKINKEKTNFFTAVFFLLLAVSFLFNVSSAGAAGISGDTENISSYLKNIAISDEVKLGGTPQSIPTMIGIILYGLLGLLGVLCLLLIIYAGIKWMLAEGAEETIAESKAIIKTAIIGVIIIMGSYALTYFVIEKVIESTTLGPGGQIQTDVSGGVKGGPEQPGCCCYYLRDHETRATSGTKFPSFSSECNSAGCNAYLAEESAITDCNPVWSQSSCDQVRCPY
ncbi:hypothetical protein A3H03_00445 [Candidatus Kuenenbacteria bacterium RIFCSPLOWO2_12_FULL_42_13]|uniref:DUF5671 domain-containing protein n=2 Tax=Candidatus Kueneniibacteriota TaxID=1752740 RepID=A0A1F6G0Q3_9BACT|nr:MAG: hypothetical protein A3H55_03215 [Candidatus Kuenenbacteria bacterium RIFCSPLOWO2_02_FULL_42_16]OGG91675.1 MAG: hypothetical protein A3H03_00445 [Candidatus Kuenenbacteria bacterium RIFCSPLOWO2_12_FULL_42_13]